MDAEHMKRAVWERIETLIDLEVAAEMSGINAEGDPSERVADVQRAYVKGLRAGRLAAMKAIEIVCK